MNVKIKKLHPNAVIPSYAKEGDAGMDITATEKEVLDDYIVYKTGLAFAIPKGYVGLLFPRSSVSKTSLMLANGVGVLDHGYRDEVEFRFKQVCNLSKKYNVGDRIGQIIIIPFPEIEFVEVGALPQEGNRGGGFGHTGN